MPHPLDCEIRSDQRTDDPLRPTRILIAEDEVLVGYTLQLLLMSEFDCEVLGPFMRVCDAQRAVLENEIDFAILDVRLRDGEIYPVADILFQRNIPFVFHSGHAEEEAIGAAYDGAPLLDKPASDSAIVRAIREALVEPFKVSTPEMTSRDRAR
ncbi:response regulator [Acuticoccus sp. M5D2P5]|uniref:response regulator n=1 Tax=Acuticoccus kalidii TaxID=2910977 RepID=UPI001F2DB5F2|nr:response regulator [Acuticoccus kalidii]MCF3932644.1 response regulator [Acuticoccus kalidii]